MRTLALVLVSALIPSGVLAAEGESSFSARIEAGGSVRTLYSVGYVGGLVEGGIGGRIGNAVAYVTLGGFLGRTSAGLLARDVRLGGVLEFVVFSIMRFGLGLHAGSIGFQTQTGAPSLATATLGFDARLTFDVIPFGDGGSALYLGASGSADLVPIAHRESWEKITPRSWVPLSAALQLGVRY